MRIAMCNVDLPPDGWGGVAAQTAGLAAALQARGHEVTVHSLSTPPNTAFGLTRLPLAPLLLSHKALRYAGMPLVLAAARFGSAELIHVHGDSELLWRRNVPVVRTFHGTARAERAHAERLRRRIAQAGLVPAEQVARALATLTVGVSQNTRAAVGKLDAVIPCGVDCELFHPGEKSRTPSILFVGTWRGRKRGRLLAEAFGASVRPRIPQAELWMVCDEPVSGEGIRWLGRIRDAAELARRYREAWIFCMPSSYEGFGVPYIEAFASGTVVVSTPNPGALEVVAPTRAGLLVDEPLLGDALHDLLADGEERRRREGAAREWAERFSWERVASEYEALYARALERKRARHASRASA